MKRQNPMKQRRREKIAAEEDRRWTNWLETEGCVVQEVGLPPVVWSSEVRWQDFVANGTLHVTGGMPSDFSYEGMAREDLLRLLAFLENYLNADEFAESGLVYGVREALEKKR